MAEEHKTEYRFEGYVLDISGGKLKSPSGATVPLSSRAFAVLQLLAERRGEVLSKAELMDAAWAGVVVEENNLNQAISSIRKALGDSKSESRFIQTVPGRGYRFTAALEAPAEQAGGDAPSPRIRKQLGASGLSISFWRKFLLRPAGLVTLALAGIAVLLVFSLELYQAQRGGADSQPVGTPPQDASFSAYRYQLAANAAYFNLDYKSAWELSKQAIALEPDYYDALYTFASVNTVLIGAPFPGMDSRQHASMAMEAARRMIKLQPGGTEGHALKAAVHSTKGEWVEVAEEIETLKALDASLADMRFLASVLLCLGDFDGAVEILKANLLVEPVNLYSRGFLMAAHELAGNRLQARQEYELGEVLTPHWWGDTVEMILSLGRNEPLKDIDEQQDISDELKAVLHRINQGRTDDLTSALLQYREREVKTPAESIFYSSIAAYLGQHELSLDLMSYALEDVWLNFYWLWLPVFDEARKLDSFKELLAGSGILAYWEKYGWPEMCQRVDDSFECAWQAYP